MHFSPICLVMKVNDEKKQIDLFKKDEWETGAADMRLIEFSLFDKISLF